ncbi:hypothetical protein CEXT_137801 [Caerostris extrusa]|uniref:Uncharacterized protein n=1 Tax=Caerostris extrusa TaxID=172846 RepID=A0AAV4NCV9_CAEEX|nr:hypothetical protein CEXT_137801 [Caerostris extrusa]
MVFISELTFSPKNASNWAKNGVTEKLWSRKARASLIQRPGNRRRNEAHNEPLKHIRKFCQELGILPNLVKNGNSFEMTPNVIWHFGHVSLKHCLLVVHSFDH